MEREGKERGREEGRKGNWFLLAHFNNRVSINWLMVLSWCCKTLNLSLIVQMKEK